MYIYSPFSLSFPFIYLAHGTDEDFPDDDSIGGAEGDNIKDYILVCLNIVFISVCISVTYM